MFYRSFFYKCLVNLYFKKKYFLGGFQGQKYSFVNTETYLVKKATLYDLNNLCLNNNLIRLSTKFKFLIVKRLRKAILTTDLK